MEKGTTIGGIVSRTLIVNGIGVKIESNKTLGIKIEESTIFPRKARE